MTELVQRAKNFLFGRRNAYRRAFGGEAGDVVLADLAKFCRATESTFHTDPRVSAVLQGRHEVWVRIAQHLNLTDEQLWAFYGRNQER